MADRSFLRLLMNGKFRTFWRVGLGILVGVAAFFVLFYLLDMGCVFRWMTGVSCPGCGATRGVLALFRLDFSGFWRYYPAGVVVFPALLVIFFVRGSRWNGQKGLPRSINIIYIFVAVISIGIYLLRLFVFKNDVTVFRPEEGAVWKVFKNFIEKTGS